MAIEELKRLALAATPGPWRKGNRERVHRVYADETEDRLGMDLHIHGNGNRDDNRKNAAYIAAANPATILALIAQLEEVTAKKRELALQLLVIEGQDLDGDASAKEAPAVVDGELPPLPKGFDVVYIDAVGGGEEVECFSATQMRAYGQECARKAGAGQAVGAGHFTMNSAGQWEEVSRNAPNSTILYHGPDWPQKNSDPFSHEERVAADVKYQLMKTSYQAEIKVLREKIAAPAAVAQPEEDAFVIQKLGELLAGVCIALKGPELELHRHSYHDIVEVAEKIKLELDLFRAREEATPPAAQAGVLKNAERYLVLRDEETGIQVMTGNNGQWGECGHRELYGEELDSAIDAAMKEKQ